MGRRAQSSGIRLTAEDAAVVKAMLARGDRQHDIAAWFGVNGGRIGEIASRQKFRDVKPIDRANLPPPGPYPSGREANEVQGGPSRDFFEGGRAYTSFRRALRRADDCRMAIYHLHVKVIGRKAGSSAVASAAYRSPKHDLSTWTVTDDWPNPVPVTEAEIEVFERWFGDLFDELFGSSDP